MFDVIGMRMAAVIAGILILVMVAITAFASPGSVLSSMQRACTQSG